ncbi:MAG: BLUF domain-containing protein [Pseudomonadota bacterium]
MNEPSLLRMSYKSVAVGPLDLPAVCSIVEEAARNNARLDISGGLVFRNAQFLQVLEGPPAAVRAVYERIAEDRRHRAMVRLSSDRAVNRLFTGTWMGLADGEAIPTAFCLRFGFEDFAELDTVIAGQAIGFVRDAIAEFRLDIDTASRPRVLQPVNGRLMLV